MSFESSQDSTVKQAKDLLFEAVNPNCRDCISTRILVNCVGKLIVGKKCDLEEVVVPVADFVDQCEEGPGSTIGCDEFDNTCNHPEMAKFSFSQMDAKVQELLFGDR